MRLAFRQRLFLVLFAVGTLPLAAALVALALFVRSAASPAGPRAALDEIAASGRAMITAVDTTALPDSARAAVRRHAEAIGRRTTLARRAETLSRSAAAALGLGLLLATAAVIVISLWFVRRWSRQISAPVEELVEWTRRIEQGDALPHTPSAAGPPEVDALRAALRDMAAALDAARRREVERERLAAFRETARRVAHEMRGPLNAIELALGRTAAGRQGGSAAGRNADAYWDVVAEETARLKQLAAEFAEFGRLPEGPESEIDVTELLDGVVAGAVPADCPVSLDVTPDLTVRARYEPLRRAVENIVRNAVEAADARGVALRADRDEHGIRIAVSDHGPGIPVADRERIFEPYATTRVRGTGLGLAIARQAVAAHGGTIAAGDTPGGGATFTITLPAP